MARPKRDIYQIKRALNLSRYIEYLIKRKSTTKYRFAKIMNDYFTNQKEKKNIASLQAWVGEFSKGHVAMPSPEYIHALSHAMTEFRMDDRAKALDGNSANAINFREMHQEMSYLHLSCSLHFIPLIPMKNENIKYLGSDWYQSIKTDPFWPSYFLELDDCILREDIAIDIAEIFKESVEEWQERIKNLMNMGMLTDQIEFLEENLKHINSKAFYILTDWLIYRDLISNDGIESKSHFQRKKGRFLRGIDFS